MNTWKKCILNINSSIQEAINNLNKTGFQINLIVDDKKNFIGTLTDGDLRQAILNKINLNSSIKKFINFHPITANEKTTNSVLVSIMQKNGILHIPIIKNKKIINLKIFRDLIPINNNFYKNLVLIMAGGQGQRLRPLTNSTPKPMLEINNKPVIETLILNISRQGFKNVLISVNYLADKIKNYFKNGKKFGINISYINEKNPLGTAGALSLINKKFLKESVIITNGDLITNIKFDELLRFHNFHKPLMTVVVKPRDTKHSYGVIDLEGIQVKNFTEKPITRVYYNTGIYVLDKRIILKLKKFKKYDMPDIVYLIKEKFKNKKNIIAYPLHEEWIDIGDMNDLKTAGYISK